MQEDKISVESIKKIKTEKIILPSLRNQARKTDKEIIIKYKEIIIKYPNGSYH